MAALKPKMRDDLAIAEIGDETIVYDDRTGSVLHFDPALTVMLGLFDGSATMKQTAAEIAEAWGLPTDEVERQVRRVHRHFRELGLLAGTPDPHEGHDHGDEREVIRMSFPPST